MLRFNPSTRPSEAIESGFYVEPPNPLANLIANRLELEPASSHLIAGGIGSGKSTTLLMIKEILTKSGDIDPELIDVPTRHKMRTIRPGVLLALAAVTARAKLLNNQPEQSLDDELKRAVGRVQQLTKGYWDYVSDPPFDEDDYHPHPAEVWVEGILEAPGVNRTIAELRDITTTVVSALPSRLVLLLDGLDRLDNVSAFSKLVASDVAAMNAAGVGVVVVGPQQISFRPSLAVQELFTAFHLQAAWPSGSQNGGLFLKQVLRARGDADILPDDSCHRIVQLSGGLLRDLIGLARASGEEAYASGADLILPEHVDAAADRFGRSLLLGITEDMAKRLQDFVDVPRIGKDRAPRAKELRFTLATELDLSLLLGRLIIEVQDITLRYIPHPTTVHLIPDLPS